MSKNERERAIQLLDQIPESKMYYIMEILERAAIPDDILTAETIEATQEIEKGGC